MKDYRDEKGNVIKDKRKLKRISNLKSTKELVGRIQVVGYSKEKEV